MMPPTRFWSRLLVYLTALALTWLTLYLRQGIVASFAPRQLLILFVLPIALSALLGGGGPAVVATLAAASGLIYLAAPPIGNLPVESSSDRLSIALLIFCGFAIALLGELLRRSQHLAAKNHQLLKALVSAAPDPVFIKDRSGKYLLINDSAARYVGKRADEIIGQDDRILFQDPVAMDLIAQDREIMRCGQVQTGERTYTTWNGVSFHLLMNKGPIFDSSGQVIGVFGIGRDITERKRMEDALRQSEEHMRMAMGAAPMGTWDWNIEKDEIYWSDNLWALFGLPPQEGPLQPGVFKRAIHPEDSSLVLDAIQAAIERDAPYRIEFRVVKPDGSVRWALSHGRVIRNLAGHAVKMVGVDLDITERKKLEQALRAHRERLEQMVAERTLQLEQRERDLHALLDHMPALIAYWDRTLHNRFANSSYEEWFGFKSEHIPGMHLPDVIGDALYSLNRSRIEAVLKGHGQNFEVITPASKNKESRHLLAHYIPEVVAGEVKGFYVLATDITPLKEIESALRTNQERLRAIFDVLPMGIAIIDGIGRVIDCNPACERLMGLRKQEHITGTLAAANGQMLRADGTPLPAEEDPASRAAREHIVSRNVELRIHRPTGDMLWLSVNAMPISHPHEGAVIAYEDITQRKQMERQKHLLQERMEESLRQQVAMQTIAALAHQFNQPLTAIRFYLETGLSMLGSGIAEPARLEMLLQNCVGDVDRAGDALHKMVLQVYKPPDIKEIADLNELVQQSCDEFKSHSRAGYRLTLEPLPTTVKVKIHVLQTHKILENLLRNCEEAMHSAAIPAECGRIDVRTELVDRMARVTVEDNGPGITDQPRSQAFDPFFTTKEHGMGMGLAISRSLAEAQDGRLWFETLPVGVRFHLTLPLAEET